MPALALAGLIAFFAVAFGWRSWRQWQRTGSTGFRGISGAVGSAEWCGGVLFAVALAAIFAAPCAAMAEWLDAWPALATPGFRIAGMLLAAAGMAGTVWSQVAMGDAWRIGVDAGERTNLVASGPFRLVRNPIFTSMVIGMAGIALLVPNLLSAIAVGALVIALQLQVRLVEEPYLLASHGAAYRDYAMRAGRFLPALGRLR